MTRPLRPQYPGTVYHLMDNHYHLLVETPDANLSFGMRQLNGMFTLYSNRMHHTVGHVFQRRYKSILVEKDSHLRELCRYLVLNPVRAVLKDMIIRLNGDGAVIRPQFRVKV